MKNLAAGAVWFLASWFLYDVAAFVFGMPRQITPLVALVVAGAIGLLLRLTSFERPSVVLGVGASESDVPRLN